MWGRLSSGLSAVKEIAKTVLTEDQAADQDFQPDVARRDLQHDNSDHVPAHKVASGLSTWRNRSFGDHSTEELEADADGDLQEQAHPDAEYSTTVEKLQLEDEIATLKDRLAASEEQNLTIVKEYQRLLVQKEEELLQERERTHLVDHTKQTGVGGETDDEVHHPSHEAEHLRTLLSERDIEMSRLREEHSRAAQTIVALEQELVSRSEQAEYDSRLADEATQHARVLELEVRDCKALIDKLTSELELHKLENAERERATAARVSELTIAAQTAAQARQSDIDERDRVCQELQLKIFTLEAEAQNKVERASHASESLQSQVAEVSTENTSLRQQVQSLQSVVTDMHHQNTLQCEAAQEYIRHVMDELASHHHRHPSLNLVHLIETIRAPETVLEKLKAACDVLRSVVELYCSQILDLDSAIKEYQVRISDQSQTEQRLLTEIQQLTHSRTQCQHREAEAVSEVDHLKSDLRDLHMQLTSAQERCSALTVQLHNKKAEDEPPSQSLAAERESAAVEQLRAEKDSVETTLQHAQSKIQRLEQQLDACQSTIHSLRESELQLQHAGALHKTTEDSLVAARSSLDVANKELATLRGQCALLTRQLHEKSTEMTLAARESELKDRQSQSSVHRLTDELHSSHSHLSEKDKQIEQLRDSLQQSQMDMQQSGQQHSEELDSLKVLYRRVCDDADTTRSQHAETIKALHTELDTVKQQLKTALEDNEQLSQSSARLQVQTAEESRRRVELEAALAQTSSSHGSITSEITALQDRLRACQHLWRQFTSLTHNMCSQTIHNLHNTLDQQRTHDTEKDDQAGVSLVEEWIELSDLLGQQTDVETHHEQAYHRDLIRSETNPVFTQVEKEFESGRHSSSVQFVSMVITRFLHTNKVVLNKYHQVVAVNRKLEEALRRAESAHNANDTQKDQLIKQTRMQYESLLHQFKKLQSDCRDAFRQEEEAKAATLHASVELERLEKEKQALVVVVEEARASQDAAVKVEREKIAQRDNRIAQLEAATVRLESTISSLHADIEQRVKERLDRDSQHESEVAELLQRIHEIDAESRRAQSQLQELSRGNSVLHAERDSEIEELRKRLRQYELDAEAMQSLAYDFSELQRQFDIKRDECDRNATEKANLQLVLEQFQAEQFAERQSVELEMSRCKNDAEMGRQAMHENDRLREERASIQSKLRTSEEELSNSLKYVRKLLRENETLRKGFQQTMERLHKLHSDENMVDRRLVVKLLVTYFERYDKQEVLQLMSRILQFTDEEKRRIGVGKQASLGGTFMSFLLGDEDRPSVAVDSGNHNLADLWVDFLLKETGADRTVKPSAASSSLTSSSSSFSLSSHNHDRRPSSDDLDLPHSRPSSQPASPMLSSSDSQGTGVGPGVGPGTAATFSLPASASSPAGAQPTPLSGGFSITHPQTLSPFTSSGSSSGVGPTAAVPISGVSGGDMNAPHIAAIPFSTASSPLPPTAPSALLSGGPLVGAQQHHHHTSSPSRSQGTAQSPQLLSPMFAHTSQPQPQPRSSPFQPVQLFTTFSAPPQPPSSSAHQ